MSKMRICAGVQNRCQTERKISQSERLLPDTTKWAIVNGFQVEVTIATATYTLLTTGTLRYSKNERKI